MKRIHDGKTATKHMSGIWRWDTETDSLQFESHPNLGDDSARFIETNGFRFLNTITVEEEVVYRRNFGRAETADDYEVITIEDVLELVLYLMPKAFLSKRFLLFIHQPEVHNVLHSLLIYFSYFLCLVELVIARRDELNSQKAMVDNDESLQSKRILSIHLSQYRMLLGRNYSIILKGEGNMRRFHHMNGSSIGDKVMHEQFLAVATQIVWISMHRRGYSVIEMEMNRLFRSEHFMSNRRDYLQLTPAEKSFLYGRRHRNVNYRVQEPPVIEELHDVPVEDVPILWIGKRKYHGTDLRIATIELEYIVPCAQLYQIDVARGIIGHPKRLYDTMLNLNWPAVREEHYSLTNDPYQIVRQPTLQLPALDEEQIRKMCQHYEHFLSLHRKYDPVPSLEKWLHRDEIIRSNVNFLEVDVLRRCEIETATGSLATSHHEIVTNYLSCKRRSRRMNRSRLVGTVK